METKKKGLLERLWNCFMEKVVWLPIEEGDCDEDRVIEKKEKLKTCGLLILASVGAVSIYVLTVILCFNL